VSTTLPRTGPTEAVIVAVPRDSAVASPDADTDTMAPSDELQAGVTPTSGVPRAETLP